MNANTEAMSSVETKMEKAPPSSSIKLTTFALYSKSRSGEIKVHAGASDARIGDDGKIELLAGSVPFNAKAFAERGPKPGHGMLMLYGLRDSLDEMMRWRAQARKMGANFAFAEIEVDIGYLEPKLINRDLLKRLGDGMRFGNLRRMVVDLQTDIMHRFEGYLGDRKGKDFGLADTALHPELYDNLFEDDTDLAHLNVMVVMIADDPASSPSRPKMRQVAYVRPGIKILSIKQGSTDARIVLPSWMTDLHEASRFKAQSEVA